MTKLRMRTYDSEGRLQSQAELLKEIGFAAGQHVIRKGDMCYAQIISLEKDHAILTINGETCKVSATSFLAGEWTRYVPKQEATELQGRHDAADHPDFKAALMKGKVFEALNSVQEAQKDVAAHLKIRLKPGKGVVTGCAFKRRSLILVPVTTKVEIKPVDKSAGQGPQVGELLPGLMFSLAPWFVMPKEGTPGAIAPFFFVQTTQDQEESNMEMGKIKAENGLFVPVMRNTEAIEEGEELRLYQPKVQATRKLAAIEKVQEAQGPKPKRARGKKAE